MLTDQEMNTISLLSQCERSILTANSDYLSWEEKYREIFSKDHSERIFSLCQELNIHLDYCDPDTTYKEDVLAFTNALEDLVRHMLR